MALDHFIVRRRRVRGADGREYVCRGPTVATIHLALGYYAAEILAARSAWDDDQDVRTMLRQLVGAILLRPDERAHEVLSTCVDGDLTAASAETIRTLADTSLALCDLPRVLDGLEIPDEAPDTAPSATPPGPDPQTVAVVRLAQEFSCQPVDVIGWPYEALLDAMEVIQAQAKRDQANGAGVDPAGIRGIGGGEIDLSGRIG